MNKHPLYEPLTEQELQILRLKAQRLSNKEIANQLVLAVSTVKWYIGRIYRKLDVSNRRDAINRANELGLLETDGVLTRTHTHNLPAQQTQFIGRKDEIDHLMTLIEEGRRLITILGPGGIGKTRLALRVAERLLIKFTDDVYFVPLAPLGTSDDILNTIAFNLDYQFVHDGRAPKQQILTYLQDKQLLLVIDNFEHVLDGSILLSEILSTAPNVMILATSRERLNLHSETSFAIRGLAYPKHEIQVEDAQLFDAVRLFVRSAHRVQPDFSLHDENIESVIRICEQVDGLPLGIELAARWIDHLPTQHIAREIAHNIDILQSEYRDIPPRLRSIRATLNYSWGRLSEPEQAILAKLSVFKGGFTAESSGFVAQADLISLRKLAESSMLRQNPSDQRYDMHPLVQQYAEEKMHELDERVPTLDAHLQYFAPLLLGYQVDLIGAHYHAAMDAIAPEIDNVRAMWDWGVNRKRFDQLISAVPVIGLYYRLRSMNGELIQMLEKALAALETMPETDARARIEASFQVLLGITMATSFGYGAPEVGTCLEKARKLCHKTSNSPQKLPALVGLYNYYHVIADYQHANEIGHAILDLADEASDSGATLVAGHYGLSASNLMVGNLKESLAHGELVLKHFEPAMATELILLSDVNLGAFIGFWVALAQQVLGYSDQAQRTIEASIDTARQCDHLSSLALVLGIMPYVCHVRGDMVSLRKFATEAIQIAQEHDLPFPLAQASIFYGYSEALAGHVEQGLAMIEQSMFAFQAIGSSVTEGYFRMLKAEIFCNQRQNDQAIDELHQALDCIERINERWYEAELHRQLGAVYQELGDHSLARQHIQKALELAQHRRVKWFELRAAMSQYDLEKDAASNQQLRDIVDWFDEGLDMPYLQQAISAIRAS